MLEPALGAVESFSFVSLEDKTHSSPHNGSEVVEDTPISKKKRSKPTKVRVLYPDPMAPVEDRPKKKQDSTHSSYKKGSSESNTSNPTQHSSKKRPPSLLKREKSSTGCVKSSR